MKKIINKNTLNAVFAGLVVVALFIFASYIASEYTEDIRALVNADAPFSMLAYVLITAIAIVIAPISTLPLIPLASTLWGWIISGILSIIGWVIGSQIAFLLARKYGKPLIKKLISIDKLEKIERSIPTKNIFWTIVLLRMTVPVDVLSYALGLFSEIKVFPYFWSTIIGVTPFAFIFAYTGTLSTGGQLITLVEVGFILYIVYYIRSKIK